MGVQQSGVKRKRLAERRALRAQPAEIRGMFRIAGNLGTALPVGFGQHAAADPTIRTGGAHRCRQLGMGIHGKSSYAAALAASARPKIRSSRKVLVETPERIRSRYHGPSEVSPNSTAPASLPPSITSFR